jgi:hypothetical protein
VQATVAIWQHHESSQRPACRNRNPHANTLLVQQRQSLLCVPRAALGGVSTQEFPPSAASANSSLSSRAITAYPAQPAQPPAHRPPDQRIRRLDTFSVRKKHRRTGVQSRYHVRHACISVGLPSRACSTWRARRPREIGPWPIRLIGGLSGNPHQILTLIGLA